MKISVRSVNAYGGSDNLVFLVDNKTKWTGIVLSKQELAFVRKEIKRGVSCVQINHLPGQIFILSIDPKKDINLYYEHFRRSGYDFLTTITAQKINSVVLFNKTSNDAGALLFAEGLALSNYQFLKYKKNSKSEINSLNTIKIYKDSGSRKLIQQLQIVIDATFKARDLVNEPLSYLTATQLSNEIRSIGKSVKLKVDVFNKAKIKSLKMGGLLAVNRGSINPPTFNVIEWKPKNKINDRPTVLIGKGVVFDTGGLSLKPTPNSMDFMKSDMAGAAAVISTMYALAKANIPVHVIGLIPSTDNRPGENAYVPGDVVKMHSGTSVEVLNTDAEGRMILADALSYAKRYDPELVIDLATLTGAAARAIGQQGIVFMGTANDKTKTAFEDSGNKVHERLVEFPLWQEYDEQMKSDIADIRNIGGATAGAITAGKFLQIFTDYPWLHVDIAGMAFLHSEDAYRSKNGTGVGVRLLFQFFLNRISNGRKGW